MKMFQTALLIILSILSNQAAAQNKIEDKMKEIKIGIVPWDTPEKLKKMYGPLIAHIEKQLGLPVSLSVTSDYTGLKSAMVRKSIDIGIFTSRVYVSAKTDMPELRYLATHVTRDNTGKSTDYYKGLIVGLKKSNLKSIEDLKNRNFAFTSTDSSSGYLFPNTIFQDKGIDTKTYFKKIFWLQKHPRIIGALMAGSIDAGATWDGALKDAIREHGDIFQIIAETEPIPNDPVAAAPHVPDAIASKLQALLLSLKEKGPVISEMQASGFGDIGFSKRDDSFYNIVRKLKD